MKNFKKVPCQLVGKDGNAYFIMARVVRALNKAGYGQEVVDEYMKRAKAGDYDNLLQVTLEYVDDTGIGTMSSKDLIDSIHGKKLRPHLAKQASRFSLTNLKEYFIQLRKRFRR